jgi:hypothetical protein
MGSGGGGDDSREWILVQASLRPWSYRRCQGLRAGDRTRGHCPFISVTSGYSFHTRPRVPRLASRYLRFKLGSRSADDDMGASPTRVVYRYVQLEKEQEASGASRAEPSLHTLAFTTSETVASLSRAAIDVRRGGGGHGV